MDAVRAIVRALGRAYPGARTALRHENAFQLLIATILSAQTTDEGVNAVTPELFARYPDADALAAADPQDVERIVHRTGFFRQKTRSIIGCAAVLRDEFGGRVPATIDELVRLPGVARKTANVVLSNCFTPQGIFVDTHVRRVSQRLGLTTETDPDRIERDLTALVPKSKWADLPHQMILLGRGPCDAKRPRHDECPLLRWCPTGRAQGAANGPRPATADRPPPSSRRTRGSPDATSR